MTEEEYNILNIPIYEWNEDDIYLLINQIHELVEISFDNNYKNFYSHGYKQLINTDVTNYLVELWELETTEQEFISDLIKNISDEHLEYIAEDKYVHKYIEYTPPTNISEILNYLKSKPQPEQKTQEWYDKRHNMITASNLWKVFKSESSLNSIIYDKCKPQSSPPKYYGGPMEWGNKYEPVSIMVYEDIYNTTIDDFGCITHDTYDFIGASPDGINVDSNSKLFGRMLEIKNIFNREITGIPKEEYWVQMQVQMETCKLDYCDFFETRFKEYEEKEFHQDNQHTYKGVLLHFSVIENRTYIPKYVYYPVKSNLDKDSIQQWIHQQVQIHTDKNLFKIIYYYLEEQSCVVIKRNKKWFETVKNDVEKTWNTILKERIDGYEHRCAKPRSRSNSVTFTNAEDHTKVFHNLSNNNNNVCLIRLNENGQSIPVSV